MPNYHPPHPHPTPAHIPKLPAQHIPLSSFVDPLIHFEIDPLHSLTVNALGQVYIRLAPPAPSLSYDSIRQARAHWPDARPDAYGVTDPIAHQLLLLDPPHAIAPYTHPVARYLIHLKLRAVRKLQRQGSPLVPPDELDTSIAALIPAPSDPHAPSPPSPSPTVSLLPRLPHIYPMHKP